jgi:hypothetical protein
MYRRAEGTGRLLPYEDIVVEAFERYPADFQLRGYPQYPDASDIHKPLYLALSKAGYVTAVNKQFKLTQAGLAMAREMIAAFEGSEPSGQPAGRLDREGETEVARLTSTRAYVLYRTGRGGEVVDSDFYSFFKVSVRTKPHEFEGRLRGVADLLRRARDAGFDVEDLEQTRHFLLTRFGSLVDDITGGQQ